MNTPYPHYDVLDKWNSPSFDDTTRRVLEGRMRTLPARRFFTEDEWRLMEALVARLVPQPDRSEPIPVVPWVDEQLFTGRGEGFRHENMPQQQEAWRLGLAAIDGEAQCQYARCFVELGSDQQDRLLQAIASEQVEHALWSRVPAERFFIHVLLKTVAGIYYSHPAAWSEIGFGGPASPRGYVRLGFDERDAWEAKEVR
jgi:hypothetical protein